MRLIVTMFVVAGMLGLVTDAEAQWGDVRGRIVFDGEAPTPPPANVTKDLQFCGPFNLKDESLLVNPDNGGLKNAVIFIYAADGTPPIHPDYEAALEEPVVLDNSQCRFSPHVATVRTGQTVIIGNKDTVGHNTNIQPIAQGNQAINVTIPAGRSIEHSFSQAERLPVTVSCSIHPWMSARVVVQDHPYMAVTDENGEFVLENVPEGEWTFMLWHEAAGYLKDTEVGGEETNRRGQIDVEIESGDNEWGEIQVSPELFEKD